MIRFCPRWTLVGLTVACGGELAAAPGRDGGVVDVATHRAVDASPTDAAPTPDVAVLSTSEPRFVALDDTSLFWTDGKRGIVACAKADCTNTAAVLWTDLGGSAIAVDAATVYWVNPHSGALMACPKSGCNATSPTELSSNACGALALDTTSIYWVTCDNRLAACDKHDCTTTILASASSPDLDATDTGLAVGSGRLFWTTNAGVMTCSAQACSPTLLVSGQGGADPGVAVNASEVLWTEGSQVWGCATGGCGNSPTSVMPPQGLLATGLTTMTADDANVYWAIPYVPTVNDGTMGAIFKCPVTGCAAPTVVVDHQQVPESLALDAVNLYWADPAKGYLLSTAK